MARTLYLCRHAEAAAKEARQEDRTRELTPAGIKDALHLGLWLREQNTTFDLVVTSSALRAEQTARLITEAMKTEPPRTVEEDALYEASVGQLLEFINNIEDGYTQVLLIGHNPAISYLAEYLTKADTGNLSPGSVVAIRFDLASWKLVSENTGTVATRVSPEMVARY